MDKTTRGRLAVGRVCRLLSRLQLTVLLMLGAQAGTPLAGAQDRQLGVVVRAASHRVSQRQTGQSATAAGVDFQVNNMGEADTWGAVGGTRMGGQWGGYAEAGWSRSLDRSLYYLARLAIEEAPAAGPLLEATDGTADGGGLISYLSAGGGVRLRVGERVGVHLAGTYGLNLWHSVGANGIAPGHLQMMRGVIGVSLAVPGT